MRRRRFISILGAACLRAQTPPSSKDDWPQFRGNPQLTGVAASFLPATLKLVWTYEAGDSIESSAAIVAGVVYVGSMAAGLISLDLQTGKLRWKYPVQDGIEESSPAVRGGIVYVGDLSGVLHAVNAQDGKSLWTLRTGAEIKSSPVVVGDRLLVGSYDGNLYCVAARTGAGTGWARGWAAPDRLTRRAGLMPLRRATFRNWPKATKRKSRLKI